MLHKFEGEDHGAIQVCDPARATELADDGWRLLGILEAEVMVAREEEVVPAPPPTDGTYHSEPVNLTYTRHFTETQFAYVMAQPKDEHVKQLVEERDEAHTSATSAWEQIAELKEDKTKLIADFKRLTEQEKALTNQVAAARDEAKKASDRADEAVKDRKAHVVAGNKAARVYRERMAIIWQELGAARMRELLGPDVESPVPTPKPKTAMERIADDEGPVE